MYTNHTSRELKTILRNRNSLTMLSKIRLRDEFKNRNLVLGSEEFQSLINLISLQEKEIEGFEYLNKIGFKLERFGQNHVKITRKRMANLIDIIAMVLGLILTFVSVKSILGLFFPTENDFDLGFMDWLTISVFMLIGVIGFFLIRNSLNRFVQFLGFKLEIKDELAILNKRLNFSLVRIEDDVSKLNILESNKDLSLNLGNAQIMEVPNVSYRDRLTLQAIINFRK